MKHQDIRDKIHLTYLSLVTSQDASTINVRKLAEAAGIARSTFYIYFDNIEQLVIDIENEFLYQFEKIYKQHIRSHSKNDLLFKRKLSYFFDIMWLSGQQQFCYKIGKYT